VKVGSLVKMFGTLYMVVSATEDKHGRPGVNLVDVVTGVSMGWASADDNPYLELVSASR